VVLTRQQLAHIGKDEGIAPENSSHSPPQGGCKAEVGRHGAMKPAGSECKDMSEVELED